MGENHKLHPINFVSRLTGLSQHVIRVWERRYGAVNPARTSGNRRLYSDADIDRLQALHSATEAGHTIGRIAHLPTEAVKDLLEKARSSSEFRPSATLPAESQRDHLSACRQAIKELDSDALAAALFNASVHLSLPILLEDIVAQLIKWVGRSWQDGTIRVAHEHLASSVIRQFLMEQTVSRTAPENAPSIVIATPAGQVHELGALLAGAVAASEGWRDVYLGPNLPAIDIAAAVIQSEAKVLALSLVYPSDDPYVAQELRALRKALPKDVHIVVGGAAARGYSECLQEIGATQLAELRPLRKYLREIRSDSATLD